MRRLLFVLQFVVTVTTCFVSSSLILSSSASAADVASTLDTNLDPEDVRLGLERALRGYIAVSYPQGFEDGCVVERDGEFQLLTNGRQRAWFQVALLATCRNPVGNEPRILKNVLRFQCRPGASQFPVDCVISEI